MDFTLGQSDSNANSILSFHPAYQSNAFSFNEYLKEVNCQYSSSSLPSNNLIFKSNFESGNLDSVQRVVGREKLLSDSDIRMLSNCAIPKPVDQEYDLNIRKDIGTNGNIQWYYFAITTPEVDNHSFPLTVRFNIINMQKNDSLYNYGMKPTVFSINNKTAGWRHTGSDVCYYKNTKKTLSSNSLKNKIKNIKSRYSLSFTYTFHEKDTVYFAHCIPYTYTYLQRYLERLENDDRISTILHRSLLCSTVIGNRCDLLSITGRSQDVEENDRKPAIILTSRVHPGESNSSHVMHGLIDFLVSDTPEAEKLRKYFIFKVVPMLNPDGVIHGNYRCCLSGTDLNRRYLDAHDMLHPTVSAIKKLINSTQENRDILLYLDLHGHSKKKNSFIYGCDITQVSQNFGRDFTSLYEPEEILMRKIYSRIFPSIICKISSSKEKGYFSQRDCHFEVQGSKGGTGRVVGWANSAIMASYTIEFSFCGNGDNTESKLLKKYAAGEVSEFIEKISPTSSRYDNSLLLKDVLKTYDSATHYNEQDFHTMGKDIGLSLFYFSNLTNHIDDKNIPQNGIIASNRTSKNDLNILSKPSIGYNGIEMFNKGIFDTSLFSSEAIKYISMQEQHQQRKLLVRKQQNLHNSLQKNINSLNINNGDVNIDNNSSNIGLRVQCEASIREYIGNSGNEVEELDDDLGSDSDPSVDNVPVSVMIKKVSKKGFKNSASLLKSLRKFAGKPTKKKKKIKITVDDTRQHKIEQNKLNFDLFQQKKSEIKEKRELSKTPYVPTGLNTSMRVTPPTYTSFTPKYKLVPENRPQTANLSSISAKSIFNKHQTTTKQPNLSEKTMNQQNHNKELFHQPNSEPSRFRLQSHVNQEKANQLNNSGYSPGPSPKPSPRFSYQTANDSSDIVPFTNQNSSPIIRTPRRKIVNASSSSLPFNNINYLEDGKCTFANNSMSMRRKPPLFPEDFNLKKNSSNFPYI
jgi:hypothetical protein